MRPTVPFVLLLSCLLLGGVLAAPDARAEEAWEKAFVQAKRQQDEQLRNAVVSGKRDDKTIRANIARVVERYLQARTTQGSALSHYLYGRVLFKQSETESHKDKRKVDEAVRAMQAAQSRGAGWFATYALAYMYLTTGQLERGETFLGELLRTQGDRDDVIRLHARVLLARQRFTELKELAERLLKKNANDFAARELLVMAYMGLKDWKRAELAIRAMQMRGDKRPELRLWLVDCLVRQQRFAEAETEIVALIRERPKDVSLRLAYVDVLVAAKNSAKAITVMKQVVDAYPDTVAYLGRLSELYLRAKKPAEAEKLLLRALALCRDDKPRTLRDKAFVLRNLAFATYEQKRYEAAVGHLEELDRLGQGKLAPHLLDLLQHCYGKLGRIEDLIRTLERLRAHMEGRPEERKRLDEVIARLKRGEGAPPAKELWARNQLAELVERCSHPDVKERREALQQYFQLDLPFVDPVVYQRHTPRNEPDAECRRIVVQILGRFRVNDANAEIVRIASRYVGRALEDPDQRVRTIAAQELGRIGTPAGIIYLMPFLEHMKLDGSRLSDAGRKELEREYNAARATLAALTGRNDIEPGAPNWIPLSAASAHRVAWLAWYDSANAVDVRMRALADLDTIERVGPRWPLRYLLSDLMKKQTKERRRVTPPRVWVRTYKLMRRHVQRAKEQDPARFAKDPWFPSFPIHADADLTSEKIPALRDGLIRWWQGLPKQP